MLALKETVRLNGLHPAMLVALIVADAVYAEHSVECKITAACDGSHSKNSLHYVGCAIDLRSKTLPSNAVDIILAKIKINLGPCYDVLLEGEGTDNEHLHIEYQP